MTVRKTNKLLVGALVIVGILVMSGAIPLLEITATTNGVAYYHKGIEGNSEANGGGDLLDSTAYVTSWTGGGASEKIVIQGAVRFPDKGFWGSPLSSSFVRFWYVVKIDGNNPDVKIQGVTGTTWTSAKMDPGSALVTGTSWFAMTKAVLTLTNPCSGKVTVEFWGHHHWLNIVIPAEDDNIFAKDEAYLRSGVGSVKVQNYVVEEGTEAAFFVETAYAHSTRSDIPATDQGWILTVYKTDAFDKAVGNAVFTKILPDNYAGTVKWLVPSGSYSSSPGASNTYIVILRNELIDQADDWLFVVGPGMANQIPGLPKYEIVSGEPPYHPGDQITVRISAEKNPIGYDIKGFWVWVSYETSAGTTTQYVYEKKWYPATITATGTGTADVTWTFPDSGYARLEASTMDSMNLNSGIASMKYTVYGAEGRTQIPFDWWQLAYVIVILIAAIIVYSKAPIPQPFKMIVLLGLIALAFYFAWPLLTTDYSHHAT